MNIGQPKRIIEIEIEPDSIPLPDTVVPFPEPMPAAEPVRDNGREP